MQRSLCLQLNVFKIRRNISNARGHFMEAANNLVEDIYELKGLGVDACALRVKWLLENDRYNCLLAAYEVSCWPIYGVGKLTEVDL